ncbi:MAG: nodulation protein NfeD [Gammaproteobacteria bacterium]
MRIPNLRIPACVLLIVWSAVLISADEMRTAVVLEVNGAIGPATSDYIGQGLRTAREDAAELVIIQLDTPGGLDAAMRTIIRDIIASPVPVAIYVSPPGARAASAGTYMLYASHIAAMAPGTNLGAATPVQLGGGGLPGMEPAEKEPRGEDQADGDEKKPSAPGGSAMEKKMVNDAIAYIRSLAEMRGRNADWAEKAVREAASLSSEQALQENVIDVIAADMRDLLEKIDGRTVNVNGIDRQIDTQGLTLRTIEPDWRTELLSIITNPNIAYILMLLGIYGLFFELANPGFIVPGVIGAICLILALFAMQVLPINYAGLGLILLGICFMVGEMFMPSFGILGIGGVIAFVFGSIILFDAEGGDVAVSLPLIIAVSFLSAAFIYFALRVAINAFRKPVVSGMEQLVGSTVEIMEKIDRDHGRVYVHGEIWNARSDDDLQPGDKAKVTGMDGLVLQVEPLKEEHS